jgi:hypothetical protein
MNTPETIIKQMKAGLPMLLDAIKAVPSDKLDWKPDQARRSAHEVCVEAVTMLATSTSTLTTRVLAEYEEVGKANATLTIEELCAKAEKDAEIFYEALRAFPESDFEKTIDAPWGTMSFFDVMTYPYWNMMWHAGQINYIQSAYGDQEFH